MAPTRSVSVVDGTALLEELGPTATRLLDRHLAAARPWSPHELVPWERANSGERAAPLPAGVGAALVLNVLTEDALPFYTAGLHARLGGTGVWWDWTRRWTAEEMRHGLALHDYLAVTRAVDLDDLERRRLAAVAGGEVPTAPTVQGAFVYLALQELATRLAHANTARLLPDEAGRRLVARVAADEHLHHLFYRDVVAASLEVAPSATVVALDQQVRHFAMPGSGLPDFAVLARDIAAAGIYSTATFLEHVVEPLVLGAWRLTDRVGLDSDAERARDRTVAFIERLRRIVPRLVPATSEGPAADAAPLGGS